jgi:bifunctional non-homologous end joining protein LigD
MIFDVLAANGTDISTVPYAERRGWLEWLGDRLGTARAWTVPPRFADGAATLVAAADLGLEGVVAKRLQSTYRPGGRSADWVKVKLDRTADLVVGGWRPGARELGALLVGSPTAGGLRFRGRVGGGISAAAQRELLAALAPLRVEASPFVQPLPAEDAHQARFVRPVVVVEVRYGQLTNEGRLRFPRFVRLRLDKSAAETTDDGWADG